MSELVHFDSEQLTAALQSGVVLADFWATWCMPCRMVAPVIEQLAEEYDGRVTVGKVDVDEQGALAEQYKVMSIPTVVVFKDGEIKATLVGVRPVETYRAELDALL